MDDPYVFIDGASLQENNVSSSMPLYSSVPSTIFLGTETEEDT
jgi:hypothetical protein